ncbi:MAG: Ig-like domain-containing protein [bacterium]
MKTSGSILRMIRLLSALLAFSLWVYCAKKMLPPSPDRFPPHIVEVNARTRAQVELIFDEEIDPAWIVAESLKITGLGIRGVSRGRDRMRVLVWTEPQLPQRYGIQGVVWDMAGNAGRFRAGFLGSSRVDTIAPRVVAVIPPAGSANLFRGIRLVVRFSEPVDTTLPLNYLIVPVEFETLFQRGWEPNWQEVHFVCRDSIPPGQVLYFLLQSGVQDLEGNISLTPGWTYWSTDSTFVGVTVKGRSTVDRGTVFFQQEQTRAIVPILRDGSFEVKVPEGVYSVFGVSDTNGDGFIDLRSVPVEFHTVKESLELIMVPESVPKRFNDYCR